MQSRRSGDQGKPLVPQHLRIRPFDRDLSRGGHHGQRSCEPRKQAEHMAAPTKAANVQIFLANSEPSTHGTKRPSRQARTISRFWGKKDIVLGPPRRDRAGGTAPAADSATCSVRPIMRICRYLTLRLAADCLPRSLSISYSMVCPSLRQRRPARSTAEMWTNTSLPPPPEG